MRGSTPIGIYNYKGADLEIFLGGFVTTGTQLLATIFEGEESGNRSFARVSISSNVRGVGRGNSIIEMGRAFSK